jgi:hypothetical protein
MRTRRTARDWVTKNPETDASDAALVGLRLVCGNVICFPAGQSDTTPV